MQENPYRFPRLWPGYALAALFLVTEIVIALMARQAREAGLLILVAIALAGVVYWYVCIYKLHKALLNMTGNQYPISPGRAVGFMFIPFYNLYWMFKWPGEVIAMANSRIGAAKYKPWVPGLIILLTSIFGGIDLTIGLLGAFFALTYMFRSLDESLKIVKEPRPYKATSGGMPNAAIIALVCVAGFVLIGMLAAIAIPSFINQTGRAGASMCIANQQKLYNAVEVWAFDNDMQPGARPQKSDLVPKYMDKWPSCKGVEFDMPVVGQRPACPNNIETHRSD